MVCLWYKIKQNAKKKSPSLRSAGVGILFFSALYFYTLFFKSSLCLFRNAFGISCPGCGISRAFLAILHFDISGAFRLNLLSIPLFIGIALYYLFLTLDLFRGTELLEKYEEILSKKYMLPPYILLMLFRFIQI
ncbi:MAG: DUF2752 domain-containing protein [Ruminococcaceae bacterium]|nr:DUF2752 domain-containing protein [Oscillospiraceae bacterium]